jgi:hypothetical protein
MLYNAEQIMEMTTKQLEKYNDDLNKMLKIRINNHIAKINLLKQEINRTANFITNKK